MKKIYSFIALMLMCFVGNANAQRAWDVTSESLAEESAFVGGPENFYVLQEGDNTKLLDDGTEGTDGHSEGLYLACGENAKMSSEVTDANVVNFIEVGEKEGIKIYVMQSVHTGLFLAEGGSFVKTKAEAYRFSVRKARAVSEKGPEGEGGPGWDKQAWSEYSNIVSESRSIHAVENNAWVLCHETDMTYIGFVGDGASFASWIDTNNWLILVATEREYPAQEQFEAVYNEYFADYGSQEDIRAAFPVGTNPGNVTEAFQNQLAEAYQTAYNMLMDGASDEAYLEMIETIKFLFGKGMEEGVVPVSAGYYLLVNQRSQDMAYVNGDNAAVCKQGLAAPEAWDLASTKYIWKVENSGKAGKFYFKNWGSNRYLGKNPGQYKIFQTTEDTVATVTPLNLSGDLFILEAGNGEGFAHGWLHNDGSYHCVPWESKDAGNQWRLVTVDKDTIAKLSTLVEQNVLNNKLAALVERAETDMRNLKYSNFVEGDAYNAPADSGLVTSLLAANAVQGNEGSKEALFDGKMNTYFHSTWSNDQAASDGTEGSHWIKVDLGKEVTELVVKFTKRQGAANGHISKYALYSTTEDAENKDKGELLVTSKDSIEFTFGKANTHIAKYTLPKATRYLTFDVEQTRGKDSTTWNAMANETGPFWHASELRFYDAKDIKKNAGFDAIPAEVKQAVTDLIEKANAELAEKAAQQSTIDALDKALDNMWDAYPDPAALKEAVEAAGEMATNAVEGDGMGFFEVGAKDALLNVVNKLSADIKAKDEANIALSLEEIKAMEAELDQAIADFNAKLQLPEEGKVYFMVSKSTVAPNEEGVYPPQVDALIASVNADVENGTPVIRYNISETLNERFNALWLAVKTDKGMAFKNLANGLYMNNVYEGLTEEEIEDLELPNNQIGYSKTPKSFTLEQFTPDAEQAANGYFVMTLKKGQYLNFQRDGMVMVHYSVRNDANAPLTFIEAGEQINFEGNYNIDVEAGKTQILTMPIALNEVHNVEWAPCAYKVLGKNGNKIMLEVIEGEIPAGTPFILQTRAANPEIEDEGETMVQATLASSDYEEIGQYTDEYYNYEPMTVNGLVSVPVGKKLAAGYGVLVNNVVIPSEEGRWVDGGTGIFNANMEATDAEGDFYIEVEGDITGEGEGDPTAVEEVVIVKNVPADVYTLTGVKVRHNVKMSNATQGLPKGVYIVGGKKVIVK